MSRLRVVSSKRFEDLLTAAPGALEADTAMRGLLVEQLTPRLYSLIKVVVAGCLRCERFVDDLRRRGCNSEKPIAITRLGAVSRAVTSRNDRDATLYEEEYSCKF